MLHHFWGRWSASTLLTPSPVVVYSRCEHKMVAGTVKMHHWRNVTIIPLALQKYFDQMYQIFCSPNFGASLVQDTSLSSTSYHFLWIKVICCCRYNISISFQCWRRYNQQQRSPILFLELHLLAELSANPPTHPSVIIAGSCVFDYSWSWTSQEGRSPRTGLCTPIYNVTATQTK